MDACTHCRLCADVCPAAYAAADGELSAVFRMKGLKRRLKGRAGFFSKILGRRPASVEELKHYAGTVFRCTLCSNCEEVCPLGIRLKELWLSLREELVQASISKSCRMENIGLVIYCTAPTRNGRLL